MLFKANVRTGKILLVAFYGCCFMLVSCRFNDIYNYRENSNDSALNKSSLEQKAKLRMIDISVSDEFDTFRTNKRISNYTSKLAHDLLENLRKTELNTPIAVSTFINFENSDQNTSKLGRLISENLLGQIQNQNIPVVDVLLMDVLQINNKGSFTYNRDMEGYFYSESVKYVLTGYMTQHKNGLAINARIVQFDNKQIVSSATTLIPFYVTDLYN